MAICIGFLVVGVAATIQAGMSFIPMASLPVRLDAGVKA
jgi:hypothetical protein